MTDTRLEKITKDEADKLLLKDIKGDLIIGVGGTIGGLGGGSYLLGLAARCADKLDLSIMIGIIGTAAICAGIAHPIVMANKLYQKVKTYADSIDEYCQKYHPKEY